MSGWRSSKPWSTRPPAASRSPWVVRPRVPANRSQLAKAAERAGAEFLQVSPPFYFGHTEGDFEEHILATADAAGVGLIVYNTFWTSLGLSDAMVARLADVPNVVSIKWSTPDTSSMNFEGVISRYADRFAIIDNQIRFVTSHILGAQAIEIHQGNYWPQWAVGLWQMLERGEYAEAQREMVRVVMPFMTLWAEMETYTSGDGYLDKLCMELVGLDFEPLPAADPRRPHALSREDPPDAPCLWGARSRASGLSEPREGPRRQGFRRRPRQAAYRANQRQANRADRSSQARVYGSIRRTCACPSVRRKTHATSQLPDP